MSIMAQETAGSAPLAVIAVQCCRREIVTPTGPHPAHAVVTKYIDAVVGGAGGLPLLVPAEGGADAAEAVLARIDGLLVPGSPSNVEPHHYRGASDAPGMLHDPARDAIALPLLRAAVKADLPVLGDLPRHSGTERRLGRHAPSAASRGCRAARSPCAKARQPRRALFPSRPWRGTDTGRRAGDARGRRAELPSTRSIARASTVSRPRSPSKPLRPMARSRRSAWRRRASSSACSGTRNSASQRIRFRCGCSRPSARPAAAAREAVPARSTSVSADERRGVCFFSRGRRGVLGRGR